MPDSKLIKLIETKRDGKELKAEDIDYFVNAVIQTIGENSVPVDSKADGCQIGAMLMAIYLKSLNDEETRILTQTMTNSGHVFTWPKEWAHLVVDKHSTGGVGDKISLVLVPVLAALGLKVPMMSGRSLGHTGGTLDKMESIPGFRSEQSTEKIVQQISNIGCCIVSQTQECVPADRVLYNSRSITGTIDYPPLIIASIVSKKLAEGLSALVYDVKYGKASFFKSRKEACDTAERLVKESRGVNATALLTSMECPLGRQIGNSLEVLETIECLKGEGPTDVNQLVEALGSELLQLTKNISKDEASKEISNVIKNGEALRKFFAMIISQGVSENVAAALCYEDANKILPKTTFVTEITYEGEEGFVSGIDPLILGKEWQEAYSQNCCPGVGMTIIKSVGEKIKKGDTWLKVHHENPHLSEAQKSTLEGALTVEDQRKIQEKWIYDLEEAKSAECFA